MTAIQLVRDRLADEADPLLLAALAHDPSPTDSPVEVLDGVVEPLLQAGVEAIQEGHLLHGPGGRIVSTEDDNLALLAGDRLYAMGLELVAATGDAASIRVLSGLIRSVAEARADGDPAAVEAHWRLACEEIRKSAC